MQRNRNFYYCCTLKLPFLQNPVRAPKTLLALFSSNDKYAGTAFSEIYNKKKNDGDPVMNTAKHCSVSSSSEPEACMLNCKASLSLTCMQTRPYHWLWNCYRLVDCNNRRRFLSESR